MTARKLLSAGMSRNKSKTSLGFGFSQWKRLRFSNPMPPLIPALVGEKFSAAFLCVGRGGRDKLQRRGQELLSEDKLFGAVVLAKERSQPKHESQRIRNVFYRVILSIFLGAHQGSRTPHGAKFDCICILCAGPDWTVWHFWQDPEGPAVRGAAKPKIHSMTIKRSSHESSDGPDGNWAAPSNIHCHRYVCVWRDCDWVEAGWDCDPPQPPSQTVCDVRLSRRLRHTHWKWDRCHSRANSS